MPRPITQAIDAVSRGAASLPDRLRHPASAPRIVSSPPSLTELTDGRYTRRGQRLLDIVIAVPALLLFGLMLPGLALALRLDSPGPIFFQQDRVGINRRRQRSSVGFPDRRKTMVPGRPFRVWKLRTMVTDAEKNGPAWASQNDARVTRVGRFLRKTRLDEVPQFWNVLRGEMSVVGPRPERLYFMSKLEEDVPGYRERLLVRPGITGLAQVINGYDTDLESVRRKVALDRQYIREIGLRRDLSILARTVKVVLKGSGAH
jgi:lipopolysaccharide/colanic/teichoic acid biosynthesis glycosyltransferase